MDRKNFLAFVALIILSVHLLWACGERQQDGPDKLYVGVAYYDQSDTFLGELLSSFQEQLKNRKSDSLDTGVTVRDAAGSQRTQNDQVKELIDGGCNVLCVNLVDRADPSEIIDLAIEHQVPIIFFNREPVEQDLNRWENLFYVGANARQSGVMQGELACDVIREDEKIDRNRDGKIQYVVLEGEAGHQDTIIRTESAVDTLQSGGVVLEKLSCQIANWNRAQGQNRMVQLIGQFQDKIELVLSNNDDMALGAMDAYKKLNYTEAALPVFFGIDGTSAGLEAVRDMKLAATVYNDKEGQAEAMVKIAVALVTGEGMDEIDFEKGRCVYLPYSKVTVDNVENFFGKQAIE